MNLITTGIFIIFLAAFLVAVSIYGMRVRGLWRRIGVITSETLAALGYLYCIAFWSLTLTGADTVGAAPFLD